MHAKSAFAAAAVMAGLAVPTVAVGTDASGAQQPECGAGGTPTHPYKDRPPEEFLYYGTRPVVIGCAELASGRRFELVGYQLGRAGHSFLCIDHHDFAAGVNWGCGSNLVFGGGAIDATSTNRSHGQIPVVAGTMSSAVTRVVVRSEIRGRLREHAAGIVKVRGQKLLAAIGVRKAFGRYLAEVPSGARAASAEAFSARGRSLGLAFFPGFRGPVGQARRCYARPRVTGMRLLKPARVGRTGRIRVVAEYPRGKVAAVELTMAGRRSIRADVSRPPTRNEGGRAVITLPVRFTRQGTVGVDATAEGLPLSRRCGRQAALRRSAQSTLVVRVR